VSTADVERSAQVIARVLRRTGLVFPRGMLGDGAARLAAALDGANTGAGELDALLTAASHDLWADLQPPTLAAVRMHLARADGQDRADLETVIGWAELDDPDNPLARALTVRAAQELATALRRAEDQLRAVEPSVAAGGREGALAAARTLGVVVVLLLDLDPEDFAIEIVDYVDRGQGSDAVDGLARATGDFETRLWAREVLRHLDVDAAPAASAAARALASGAPPHDAAEDAVWVPSILALVDEGLERVLAQEAEADA